MPEVRKIMTVGTARFQQACWFVLTHETEFHTGHYGDYSDEAFVRTECVPGDAGGTTRYGIDAAGNPGVDVVNLTFDQAVAIYWNHYWRIQNHPMDDLPAGWGEVMFDIRVNGGDPVSMAQRAAQMTGAVVTIGAPLDQTSINAMQQAGSAGLKNFLHLRQHRYDVLAQMYANDAQFLAGWTARNNDLAKFVNTPI